MLRLFAVLLSAAFVVATPVATLASPARLASTQAQRQRLVLSGVLPGKRTVQVYADGEARITSQDGRTVETRRVSFNLRPLLLGTPSKVEQQLVLNSLNAGERGAYQQDAVNVVFRDDVLMAGDVYRVPRQALVAIRAAKGQAPAPLYSNNATLNRTLAGLGVNAFERIARKIPRSLIRAMSERASSGTMRPMYDMSQAYTLYFTGANVEKAVRTLRTLPAVAFVEPNWKVSTLDSGVIPLPDKLVEAVRNESVSQRPEPLEVRPAKSGAETLPSNYGITSSAQSYLNAPGVDDLAAYDMIKSQFGVLPGTGETITDVSIGDVCVNPHSATSHQIGGQDYLDVPSMPLIPEYGVDDEGDISGAANICGSSDPALDEVLLDFSVMAPLPHNMQRASAMGAGLTDLLGIAPGAKYRLVVPTNLDPTTASLVSSFIMAADQMPRPDVITASLGYSYDPYGFPDRYLEEDLLIQSIISTIVNADNEVVCIASGDGLREYTNAPVAPSGGSAGLNVTTNPSAATYLGDVALTTIPSVVTDSGAIAVGGTTTDDIFARPPQDPRNVSYANQLTYAETRWTGMQALASNFGSRVDVSAPSDNIVSLLLDGAGYNQVESVIQGGTSASAPMAAAAAAIAMQIAKRTNHPFSNAVDVRSFLEKTGTTVPNVPQSDIANAVGPQIDLAGIVQNLLSGAGKTLVPGLPRVAIAQRQSTLVGAYALCDVGGIFSTVSDDQNFLENTDPTDIVINNAGGCNEPTNNNLHAYITFAPDWESIPSTARYRLYVTGQPNKIVSRTRWTRLTAADLFSKVGFPIASSTPRSLSLTYGAYSGLHPLAAVTFNMTFGPSLGTSQRVLAPIVPAVVTGPTIPVKYDFSLYASNSWAPVQNPVIVVSHPGRTNFITGPLFFPVWTSPVLTKTKGTIDIPVSALEGGGIYGIAVRLSDPSFAGYGLPWTDGIYSDFAVTRVAVGSSKRPPAPLLFTPAWSGSLPPSLGGGSGSGSGSASSPAEEGHSIEIPLNGSFTVYYDVSSVPHATNAILEISSDGPTLYGSDNPFNNPNGTEIDNNGTDTGSVFHVALPNRTGSITLTAKRAHLVPTMIHTIRILPANGSKVVGESSDVSSIEEAGIMAADGQALTNGYSIDPNGDLGLYTSYGMSYDPSEGIEVGSSSFGLFSQANGVALALVQANTNPEPYTLYGGGYVGDHTFILNQQETVQEPNFWWACVLNCNVYLANAWTMPLPTTTAGIAEMGTNPLSQVSAFVTTDRGFEGSSPLIVDAFTVNWTNLSVSTPIEMTGEEAVNAFDYDATTNIGYAATSIYQQDLHHLISVLRVIDFTKGTATTVTIPSLISNVCSINDIAVDPNTNIGAIDYYCPTSSAVAVLNLATDTVMSTVTIPALGEGITNLAVDLTNKLFVAQVPEPAGDATDNNPLSSVAVVSESGTLVSESSRVYNLTITTLGNHWFGVNGTTRTGFAFAPVTNVDGPGGITYNQIIPFRY